MNHRFKLVLMEAPPENIDDVLHFTDTQKKRHAEKRRYARRNCSKQYAQLLEKAHVRPRIEPAVICRPTDHRQERARETNFSKGKKHLARFKPARMPAHQRVKQQKINRRNETRRKRQAAVSPPQPKCEKPVKEKIRADRHKAHQHWGVTLADRVERRRQNL